MKNILITCQYATNKGDRAIAEYLIKEIKRDPQVHVTLSTNQPELWNRIRDDRTNVISMGYRDPSRKMKAGVLKKVIRRLVARKYKKKIYPDLIQEGAAHKKCERHSAAFIEEVKRADLVIITGGHHITSIRSGNALFDVTYDIGLVSLYAKRYVLWSQTIGPLEFSNPMAKAFFGRVLRKAEAVFIRDDNSRVCLKELYPELTNVRKSFDSVFGFGNMHHIPMEKRKKKVGISIFNGLPKAFKTFEPIAACLDWFAERGYSIEFFCMEYGLKERADIQKIVGLMRQKAEVEIFDFSSTTQEHLDEMSTCRFYIGYKTHSVIMALTTATPLLGICYHKKTYDFMADYGLEMYAVDDCELDAQHLIDVAEEIMHHDVQIYTRMCNRSKEIAEVIYQDLHNLLSGEEICDQGPTMIQ